MSPFSARSVDTLELVQSGQFCADSHRLASHEDVRERLLHLEDDLALRSMSSSR